MATILLVDDDPLVRRTLTRALERIGHGVEPAETGGDQTRDLTLLEDAKLLGATATLAKPFSLDELYTLVATVLASHVPRTG